MRAVLFDVFGTVVDWRSGIARPSPRSRTPAVSPLDPHAFADTWRGRYQPDDTAGALGRAAVRLAGDVHRENLDEALREHGVDPGGFAAADLDALARAGTSCRRGRTARPGSRRSSGATSSGRCRTGTRRCCSTWRRRPGWTGPVLGSDLSRAYKPDPEAYRWPAALLGLEPGEVMLAAAHDGDLASAREAGLATAFIARPLEDGPSAVGPSVPRGDRDLAGTSITEIADLLGRAPCPASALLVLADAGQAGHVIAGQLTVEHGHDRDAGQRRRRRRWTKTRCRPRRGRWRPHQAGPRREQGRVNHPPAPVDDRLGHRVEVHRLQAGRVHGRHPGRNVDARSSATTRWA